MADSDGLILEYQDKMYRERERVEGKEGVDRE